MHPEYTIHTLLVLANYEHRSSMHPPLTDSTEHLFTILLDKAHSVTVCTPFLSSNSPSDCGSLSDLSVASNDLPPSTVTLLLVLTAMYPLPRCSTSLIRSPSALTSGAAFCKDEFGVADLS
jgi:hypothetical protein